MKILLRTNIDAVFLNIFFHFLELCMKCGQLKIMKRARRHLNSSFWNFPHATDLFLKEEYVTLSLDTSISKTVTLWSVTVGKI